MTDARSSILAKLALGSSEPLPAATPYVAPAAEPDRLTRFTAGLEKVFATHETVSTVGEIAGAVERYLQQNEASRELVVTDAVIKAGIDLGNSINVIEAPTRGNEESALAMAYVAVAETGTLVMLSGPESPVTTNFLPDNFICVLRVTDILNDMESLWARMAKEDRSMPRTVNLITGPSRTADVEQIIQMGAHGPRRLHVILLT